LAALGSCWKLVCFELCHEAGEQPDLSNDDHMNWPRVTPILAGLILVLTLMPAAAQPRRVVSINACTDQLLFKLAPERIAALSTYAADPTLSLYAEEVRASAAPLIRGTVEEVLKRKPDLVLAGSWTRRVTRDRLKQEGVPVEEFAAPSTIDEVRASIRRMAALLGEEARGAAMLRGIDDAVNRATEASGRGLSALQFQRRGFTSGEDTLLGDIFRKLGLRNAAAPLGIRTVGRAPLETVLKTRADLLILLEANGGAADQGTALLHHPALLAAYPPERRLVLASRLTVCGGPAIAVALDRLGEALRRVP
jgi:iron complex transport system substrate-binding protein